MVSKDPLAKNSNSKPKISAVTTLSSKANKKGRLSEAKSSISHSYLRSKASWISRNHRIRLANSHYTALTTSMKNKSCENRRAKSVLGKTRAYLNNTGPGEYDLPNLWKLSGIGNSRNKSSPCFSIAQRCKTPILSKFHTQDIIGKSSPGVGTYQSHPKFISGPKYSMSLDKRFVDYGKDKSKIVSYYTPNDFK